MALVLQKEGGSELTERSRSKHTLTNLMRHIIFTLIYPIDSMLPPRKNQIKNIFYDNY